MNTPNWRIANFIRFGPMKGILARKPLIFPVISIVYLLVVGLLKWWIRPPIEAMWYLAGGLLGVYFLDVAELFFQLSPSPFRSIIFQALLAGSSFFVVTSSSSFFTSGLVLSLYLSLLLWQVGEWRLKGNLSGWYLNFVHPPSLNQQRWILFGLFGFFILETWIFIR